MAEMRMAGAEYSTASYISHIIKGLLRGYNLMKRMMMVPSTHESLDEDSITSYILQDEAMQEAEQPTELLSQANYAASTKLNQQQGQRRMHGGGGSGGGRSTKDVDEKRSMRGKSRGGDGRRRECWICHDPDHLSYECPDRDDSDEDDTKGGRGRSTSNRPHRNEMPCREKKTSKKTSSTKDVDHSSSKSRGDGEASCSMVDLVEPTVSLAPEAGEDFQAVAAAVQANPMAVLLDSGCSHHLMGTKAIFVNMAPSGSVKHVCGFNGALQPVKGRGTIALQGEAGKRVLIPDVLYVLGVQANLLSAGQLKESGVQLKSDGDEMLLVVATGKSTEVVALRTTVSATMSTPERLHASLAHVSVDTIKSSAKHEVATGLDINPSTGASPPCVSCVGGKLAWHTFPAKGSNTAEALAVVHIDLCGPFRVAATDGSVYFLLLKDRHTRFVWVIPIAKKSDVLREFQRWLVLVERQAKKPVLMLRSDRGGEFLGKEFTDFVNGKGIVHDLTCPYTPQQNGMAEREMRTTVECVRTMLLHMGVQHHWWHLALRQAVWVRNCLERSTTLPGMTPYQLLTGNKPDLTHARVWGCMVQFMVPEQQRGGKLAPKARWGLHLGVSPESKGWEVLDLTDKQVVTTVEVIFYETLSLEVWKAKSGPASGRTQAHPPTDTSTAMVPLLVEINEPADEDVVEVLPPPPILAPPFPVADRPASTPVLTTGDEGSLEASAVAPASGIAGGRQGAKPVDQDGNPSTTREQQTGEPVEQEASAGVHSTGELSQSAGGEQLVKESKQLVDDLDVDREGELSAREESTDSDVVEEPITKPELRRTGRARRTPERLSFHACPPPAAFTAVYNEVGDDLLYDDAEEDDELPELDPDMHADPEHCWDISTMTSSTMIEPVEEMLEMQFKCSKMGDVKYYLGMHVERDLDKGVLRLHQRKYCEGLAEKYGLQDGGKPATPLPSGFTVEPCADEEVVGESDRKLFHSMVGALNSAANHTRPDIAFATSRLASVVSRPSHEQLEAAKRLVHYVSATASVGLEYSAVRHRLQRGAGDLSKGEMLLTCYTDASFNSVKADGTSIGGYVCLFGGGAMSWRSKKQNKVGLSSCEKEYMALNHGVKEVVWLRRLLEEIGVCQKEPIVILCDNELAVKLAKNACLHGLKKHIRPNWHWVRRLLDKEVRLEIVKTHQQAADILTKRLAENEHWNSNNSSGSFSSGNLSSSGALSSGGALNSNGGLADRGIIVTFPAHGRTAICTNASTGTLLATFTREPHSCLFVLHAASPQVAESGQVIASPQVAVSGQVAVCAPLLTPPSFIRPPLPSRPSTWIWGPAPRLGPERERYSLMVVDDYSKYTTVFPLAKKSKVTSTLIRWLMATEGTHGSRVHCLHSDCGGEFRSGILDRFCSEQGITQSWTLPKSPQQNGVAERRIGLVIKIARTSMIHARTPHFLWPYAIRYAAHQGIHRPDFGRGPLVLRRSFMSGAALHLSATPLQISSWPALCRRTFLLAALALLHAPPLHPAPALLPAPVLLLLYLFDVLQCAKAGINNLH
ncbi:unnamed protein product [Closterium sp. NIES-54]